MLDLPETRGDLWALYSRHLAPRVAAGDAKLVLACGGGPEAAAAAAAASNGGKGGKQLAGGGHGGKR